MELSDITNFIIAIATVSLAWTAYQGMHTWKKEIGHKEKLKVLMDLLEGMTELYYALKEPIQSIQYMEQIIESISTSGIEFTYGENTAFIKYQEKHGKLLSKFLGDRLNDVATAASKVQPLLLKV